MELINLCSELSKYWFWNFIIIMRSLKFKGLVLNVLWNVSLLFPCSLRIIRVPSNFTLMNNWNSYVITLNHWIEYRMTFLYLFPSWAIIEFKIKISNSIRICKDKNVYKSFFQTFAEFGFIFIFSINKRFLLIGFHPKRIQTYC